MTADEMAGRRRGGSSASTWNALDFRVASEPAERMAALRLVHHRYASSKLIEPSQLKLRVMPQHLLPTTSIFVGIAKKSVHGTVTLIRDNQQEGLPLEAIYGAEVAHLRRQGRQFAEVSCLAFADRGSPASFQRAFIQLTRLMAQFARFHGVSSLLMAVNPRHEAFYERVMGFRRIGNVKSYPSVCNNPAVACMVDFDALEESIERKFFGNALPLSAFKPSELTPHEQWLLKLASTTTRPYRELSA